MAKGHIRIITGSALIALQALAVLGNPDGGFFFTPELWLQSLLYLLGYWGHGIVGFILVKTGLNAKRTYEPVSLLLHKPQTGVFAWIRYLFTGITVGYFLLLGYRCIEIFASVTRLMNLSLLYYHLLLLLSYGFLAAYLVGFVGKRPSHLLSAVLGFSAAGNGYLFLTNFALTFPLCIGFLAGAALYGLLAVYLLRPCPVPTVIRTLGGAGAVLLLLFGVLFWFGIGNALPWDLGLHLTVFVYTVAAPLNTIGGNENG